MVEHTIKIAIPIFKYVFPEYQALFAFDNASNHGCFATDTLVASKMNRNLGGVQPLMREGFLHSKYCSQPMVFPIKHPVQQLQDKAKGIEQALYKRELWRKKEVMDLHFYYNVLLLIEGQDVYNIGNY